MDVGLHDMRGVLAVKLSVDVSEIPCGGECEIHKVVKYTVIENAWVQHSYFLLQILNLFCALGRKNILGIALSFSESAWGHWLFASLTGDGNKSFFCSFVTTLYHCY